MPRGSALRTPFRASRLITSAGKQVNDRHEKGGADDGPQNRERMPADDDHEGSGELELPGDPGPKKGPDEAKGCRDDQPATSATRDGLPDGAADSRDHDEKQKGRKRHGHGEFLSRAGSATASRG